MAGSGLYSLISAECNGVSAIEDDGLSAIEVGGLSSSLSCLSCGYLRTFLGGRGQNPRWRTLSVSRIVSGGTVSTSGYCPGRHFTLADSVWGDSFCRGHYPL